MFKNKVLMITGGTGSFGHAALKRFLLTELSEIRIFSRDENKQHLMKQELSDEKISRVINYVIGDVRDYSRLHTVCADMDIVFHAAALKQVPPTELYPLEAVYTNVIGSHNLARAAIARGVSHVVAISTDKAVKPVNTMGMTKAIQEKIFRSAQYEKIKQYV